MAARDPDFAAMIGCTDTPPPVGDASPAVWSLHFAHGVLQAGTKNANLIKSADRGARFEQVSGLTQHECGKNLNPGAEGLVMHTLLSDPADPAKPWAGISAASVFVTEDGSATWERRICMSNV